MAAKNRNGKWFADFWFQFPDGHRERQKRLSPVQTRRGAEQFEREVRQALLDGTFGKGKGVEKQVPKLSEFAEEFLSGYAQSNNKPSTIRGKEKELRNHVLPFFGNFRLDGISLREIERFKTLKLKGGLGPKTINNTLSTLHKCLSVAAEWEIIPSAPRIKWLKSPPPTFDFLNFDEAQSLVNAAPDEEWRTMILLALRTGLRQGELLELRWSDVNFEAKTLLVSRSYHRGHVGSPKSGRGRDIPLCDDALAALRGHYHGRGELVFCTPAGEHWTDGNCKWPLWAACQKAGIRRIGWHVLRHTFASHLVMRGVGLKVIQELLGHSTIQMTMRYAHLSPEAKREAVQTLNNLVPIWSSDTVKIVSA